MRANPGSSAIKVKKSARFAAAALPGQQVSLAQRATEFRNALLRRSKFTRIGVVPRPGPAASDKTKMPTLPDKFGGGGRSGSPATNA